MWQSLPLPCEYTPFTTKVTKPQGGRRERSPEIGGLLRLWEVTPTRTGSAQPCATTNLPSTHLCDCKWGGLYTVAVRMQSRRTLKIFYRLSVNNTVEYVVHILPHPHGDVCVISMRMIQNVRMSYLDYKVLTLTKPWPRA